MNQLLHWVEAHGLNQTLYDVFFVAGSVVLIAFCLWNAKNYKIPLKKAIPFVLVVYSVSVAWMFFLFWAESGFKNFGGNNIVRIFVWVPVFSWPMCKLLKLDFRTMCDYLAPVICVQHGVSHFGCIFGGCCYGYPFENGIYNHVLQYKTFPNQPIEALIAVGIVLYIWLKEKKNDFKVTGEYYPLMLILFGYSRFLLEFLRDNQKLFLGISSLAIHALVMGVVGTIWLIKQKQKNREETAAKAAAEAERLAKKAKKRR